MSQKKLRVWWIPQVPMEPFHVDVDSPKEGRRIMEMLSDYDAFQYENKVKPDYSNAGGLEEYDEENKEWSDWCDEYGNDIDDEDAVLT